jgi:hypothetical protein
MRANPDDMGYQFAQYRLCLHAGQRRPETHVCAVPERYVHAWVSVAAVLVGTVEDQRVTVGRSEGQKDS